MVLGGQVTNLWGDDLLFDKDDMLLLYTPDGGEGVLGFDQVACISGIAVQSVVYGVEDDVSGIIGSKRTAYIVADAGQQLDRKSVV